MLDAASPLPGLGLEIHKHINQTTNRFLMAAFAHVASMTPASDCLDFLLHTRHEGQTHAARNAGSLQTLGGARGGAGLGLPPSPPLCPALLFIRFLSAGRDGHPQTRLMRPLVCELEEKMKNPSSPRGPYKNLERG